MILGKLELTEQTDMSFGIDVYGTTEQVDRVRLVIEGPLFDISCHCDVANGEVTAKVPKLKGIFPAGVYEARLETIVDGKIFIPLKEQIEFNPLVEFDISKKKVQPVKEGVKVTVKKALVSEESRNTKKDKMIAKAISEGFEVTKVKDFDVLKKDGQYFGLISDTKIVFTKTGHSSLTGLVEELSGE